MREVKNNWTQNRYQKKPVVIQFHDEMNDTVNINNCVNGLKEEFCKQKVFKLSQPHYEYPPQELIVLIPKVYKFGDPYLRDIGLADYTKDFNCYRLNPLYIIEFLSANLKDKNVTLNDIKELLSIIGLPLDRLEDKIKHMKASHLLTPEGLKKVLSNYTGPNDS